MVIIRNAKDVVEHYVNCKAGDCRKCPLISTVHFPKTAISACEIITATINRVSKEINGMTQS